jgi:hypothetical protein
MATKRKDLVLDKTGLKQLEVGMEFSNLDDLMEILGIEKSNGTGYQILLREYALLKAGVEIERNGNHVIIVDINLK